MGCLEIIENNNAGKDLLIAQALLEMQSKGQFDEVIEQIEQSPEDFISALEEVTGVPDDGSNNATDLLALLLDRHGQANDKIRESTERAFGRHEEEEELQQKIIRLLTRSCERGLRTKRKYIFFGKRIVKCSSSYEPDLEPSG